MRWVLPLCISYVQRVRAHTQHTLFTRRLGEAWSVEQLAESIKPLEPAAHGALL